MANDIRKLQHSFERIKLKCSSNITTPFIQASATDIFAHADL